MHTFLNYEQTKKIKKKQNKTTYAPEKRSISYFLLSFNDIKYMQSNCFEKKLLFKKVKLSQ